MEFKKEEIEEIEKYQTDIDRLLNLIEKYGKLRLFDVAKVFNINKKEAEGWANILEEHNLIKIHYPVIGSPILMKKEDEKHS